VVRWCWSDSQAVVSLIPGSRYKREASRAICVGLSWVRMVLLVRVKVAGFMAGLSFRFAGVVSGGIHARQVMGCPVSEHRHVGTEIYTHCCGPRRPFFQEHGRHCSKELASRSCLENSRRVYKTNIVRHLWTCTVHHTRLLACDIPTL